MNSSPENIAKNTVTVLSKLALAACAGLVACESFTPQKLAGHYEGNWHSTLGGVNRTQPLAADAKLIANNQLQITLSTLDGHDRWLVTAHKQGLQGLRLEIAAAGLDPIAMTLRPVKAERKECVSAHEPGQSLHLCYASRELSLTLERGQDDTTQTWILERFAFPAPLDFEEPRTYTLLELFERAAGRNFESRIEFEHAMEARAAAVSAHRNLVPHVSSNTIAAILSVSVSSLFSDLSDLVPFLLPNRWAQWHEADLRANAARDAHALMRADSANLTEGLVYAVMQDAAIYEVLRKNLNCVQFVHGSLARDRRNDSNSLDDVLATLNDTQRAITVLEGTLLQDYQALSQAAGFSNPKAIISVSGAPEWDPANPPPLDEMQLVQTTLRRSFELRQLDSLIEAGKHEKTERRYTWLDPLADPGGALGLGLGAYVEVSATRVRELHVKREQMQSALANKVETALANLRQAAASYQITLNALAIQERRLKRLTAESRGDKSSRALALLTAFETQVQNEIALITVRHSYYVAQAKLQRLTYSGKYALFIEQGVAGPAAPVPEVRAD